MLKDTEISFGNRVNTTTSLRSEHQVLLSLVSSELAGLLLEDRAKKL